MFFLVLFIAITWAVDATEILPYYQTTRYTLAHRWPAATPAVYQQEAPREANKLVAETEEELLASALLPPVNPAPMLQPNPFANSAGQQLQFGGRRALARRHEGAFCRRSFDGRSGYCILAYQCLHVVREYRLHGTKIDVCTYRRNVPVICCPLADKHVEAQRISAQKCQEYQRDALGSLRLTTPHRSSGKQCVPSVPMIVGGERVSRSADYPHMAALGWTQTPSGGATSIKWGCGGTLISERFVLSAAHCATSDEKPPDMVRLGARNLNQTSPQQQDIKIVIIILHPKYRSAAYYHDIALLKLAKRAELSTKVRPACLWQHAEMDMTAAVVAAGWGRTEFMGHKSADLRKVDLNLIEQRQCKDLYRTERRLSRGIIDGQFCAGHLAGGKDTCQGDSGGPLHAQLPEYNCVKFIVGITSFGKFCAAPNAPGVYTKVFAYLDWIERIVFRDDISQQPETARPQNAS